MMKTEPNTRWQPMTLKEVVGLFMLPQKKPPDSRKEPRKPDSGGKDR